MTVQPPLGAAIDLFAERLRALYASGAEGFEGLMRDVLQETTGQTYRIAKSGPQGGTDVRSEAANTIQIGLEAKKYEPGTKLPLDQLRAKVLDASRQPDPVDLWILAATREISDSDSRVLKEFGIQEGVGVLILDWPAVSGALPRLAVLCACAPNACAKRLGTDSVLQSSLQRIIADSQFEPMRAELTSELESVEVGYAATATALNHWLREAQRSESTAKARLQGYNNLLEAGIDVATRSSLIQQLDTWWANPTSPMALVGEEGHGKTWCALAWWRARERSGRELPLTLFVPAREVKGTDAESLIAGLLFRHTKVRDENFWLKRLRLWSRAKRTTPGILLIIDGVDQNWTNREWADLLQPLYDEDSNGLFATLLTCRPDHWVDLSELEGMTPKPQKIDVPVFSESELNELLELCGRSRADFTPPVLQLMRVPRLSLLAIHQQKALAASGDITPERLVYEDWKHRLTRRRGRIQFSDIEFKEFVADLGRGLRDMGDDYTITRSELIDRLSRDSGKPQSDLATTISEIVDGRWLHRGDAPHQFKVHPTLTPFALGLTLAAELRGEIDKGEATGRLADFVDPLKGQSLGVAVLRAASTVALIDAAILKPARQALIERWISEQNFAPNDFEAMWRLIGADTDLFCDLIEDMWLHQKGRGFTDEALIKAAANAFQFSEAATILETRIRRWLGWIWADPEAGKFLGRHEPTTERARAHSARTYTNLAIWNEDPSIVGSWPAISLVEVGDVSWFAHRVFGIISYLDLAPFTDALVAWALGRAIMEDPRHFEELAWVVRLNERDPEASRTSLAKQIAQLTASGSVFCLQAASWLQEALGDVASDIAAAKAREQLSSILGKPINPAQIVITPVLGEGLDPTSAAVAEQAEQGSEVDGKELWRAGRQRNEMDARLSQRIITLARVAPHRLRNILGDAAVSAGERSPEELSGLLRDLPHIVFALTTEERQAIRGAIDVCLEQGTASAERDALLLSHGLLLDLFGMPAASQIDILDAYAGQGDLSGEIEAVLNTPADVDYKELLPKITPEMGAVALKVWLGYLVAVSDLRILKGWDGLALLVTNPDSDVRCTALQLTWLSRNPLALQAIVDSDWSASASANRSERAYGSLALAIAEEVLSPADLSDRMDIEVSSFQLTEAPDDLRALERFGAYVRAEVTDLSAPGSRSYPRYWEAHLEALRLLLQNDGGSFHDWIASWLKQNVKLPGFALHDDFPLVSLSKVLLEQAPELGVQMWRGLVDAMDHDIIKRQEILFLPIGAPESAETRIARDEVLGRAMSDLDFFSIARSAQKHERSAWLLEIVRRDATSKVCRPYRVARAYMLLGFADSSPDAEVLWEVLDTWRPIEGWLASVYELAKANFNRNIFARHWLAVFLNDPDATVAFGAYELFLANADGRSLTWAMKAMKTKGEALDPDRRAHWGCNVVRLEKELKAARDKLKDRLFGARTMSRTQSPWL